MLLVHNVWCVKLPRILSLKKYRWQSPAQAARFQILGSAQVDDAASALRRAGGTTYTRSAAVDRRFRQPAAPQRPIQQRRQIVVWLFVPARGSPPHSPAAAPASHAIQHRVDVTRYPVHVLPPARAHGAEQRGRHASCNLWVGDDARAPVRLRRCAACPGVGPRPLRRGQASALRQPSRPYPSLRPHARRVPLHAFFIGSIAASLTRAALPGSSTTSVSSTRISPSASNVSRSAPSSVSTSPPRAQLLILTLVLRSCLPTSVRMPATVLHDRCATSALRMPARLRWLVSESMSTAYMRLACVRASGGSRRAEVARVGCALSAPRFMPPFLYCHILL
ncbi:hypothetical protein K438DRAFT_118257 [Mycena galopus ATCC 62051]|nr:hypothetical protein K438DRAFT_118257 [Mycena galopus ATCC 62051]